MPRRRAVRAAAVVAVAALAACSDDEKRSTPAACRSTTTSAGAPATRVVANEADGFSVEVPARWTDIVLDNAKLQELFNEPEKNQLDDAIRNQINTLLQRGGKLFAYDECERTTSLNVLKVPATPGSTIGQIAESLPAQLAELELRDVKVEVATIAAGEAVKASGIQEVTDKKVELLQIQYYVLSGSSIFICVLATDDPARDLPTLEAIGGSFQLIGQ